MGRGVAMDDKKKMLLRVYHSKKEPFGLKELEKEGARAGLNEKQVKDINALLLDDNVVLTDKAGQSNIFWSFPAAQGVELKARLRAAEARLVGVFLCSTRLSRAYVGGGGEKARGGEGGRSQSPGGARGRRWVASGEAKADRRPHRTRKSPRRQVRLRQRKRPGRARAHTEPHQRPQGQRRT